MDQETWRFINTFAPWLAALGTFSAAGMALYLALRSDRIALALQAGIRKVGHVNRPGGRYVLFRLGVKIGDSSQEPPKIVWLNIKNIRRRSATITNLYWRPVPWSKRGVALIPPPNNPHPADFPSTDFPTTLDDGKSADYCWLVPEFMKQQATQQFCEEFKGFRGAIKLRLLRVCAGTSTGDSFSCKPEKELRELVRTIAMEGKRKN
jgi:hypothetical protein